MQRHDLKSALAARNRADRQDARFQLLMALPITLLGLAFANVLVLPLIYVVGAFGIKLGFGVSLGVFNAILAVVIIIDVKRQPQESWYTPRYYQSDGSVKSHEFGAPGRAADADVLLMGYLEHQKGALGGMPLMTNISDPHNIGERGRAISSGFANVILGGPRSLARALAVRRKIAARSSRRTVASAERFTDWLASQGVVPESVVKAHLDSHPDHAEGLALARDLEVVTRRRIQAEFHYHVR